MKIIETEDGSNSIYVEELNEQYHSIHGAITESMHIFIKHGLNYITCNKKQLSILEMGFGTGLNTLLTATNAEGFDVKYIALEKFPIDTEIIRQLNYGKLIKNGKDLFNQIHQIEWEKEIQLNIHFLLTKIKTSIEEFTSTTKFDIIYYDAFAPKVQPELWTEALFAKCYGLLNSGGYLVTYCAQGQVKRNMKAAGFLVEGLPGPPGKREITRALKR